MKKQHPIKLNWVLLAVTGIASLLAAVLIYVIHAGLFAITPDNHFMMPLYMGLFFAALLAAVCVTVLVVGGLRHSFRTDVITGKPTKNRVAGYMAIGAVVTALFSFGAEFLYECNFRVVQDTPDAGTYIFLIDDSGTMYSNDPDLLRYKAIRGILHDKPGTTRYAVYSFSGNSRCVVPMRTVEEGFQEYPAPDYGMTNMKAGLENVIDDLEKGVWTSNGSTSLVLITDGVPSDFSSMADVKDILDSCVANQITLGIVGVIGSHNRLMEQMATYTGGSFVDIRNIGQIHEAIRQVSGISGFTRDLLSVRDQVAVDWLYALIRILAIGIIGTLIAVCAAICYGNSREVNFIICANGIKSLLAGVLLEAGFRMPLISGLTCIAALALLGAILAREVENPEEDTGKSCQIDVADTKGGKASSFGAAR